MRAKNPPRFIHDSPRFRFFLRTSTVPPLIFCEAHGAGRDDRSQLPEPRGGRTQPGTALHRGAGAHPGAAAFAEAGVPGGHAGVRGNETRWKGSTLETEKSLNNRAGKSVKICENLIWFIKTWRIGNDLRHTEAPRLMSCQELADISAKHYQDTVFKSDSDRGIRNLHSIFDMPDIS